MSKSRYPRFGWVGNRINRDDMSMLYQLKQATRKPITKMVAEAVTDYLLRNKQVHDVKSDKEEIS